MPAYTEEVKRAAVKRLGYDPEVFTIDENNFSLKRKDEDLTTPSSADAVTTHTPVTAKASMWDNVKESIKPAVGSFTAAVPSVIAGATVAAKTPGGIIPKLVTGIGTSLLGNYGQRKLLQATSPNVASRLQQDAEENPLATLLGGTLSGLSTFKPGYGLVETGKGLVNLLRGLRIDPNQVNAIANTSLSSGIGAGLPATTALAQGESPSWKDVLAGGVGGALLSDPNKLGRVIGLPATRIIPKNVFRGNPIAPEEPNVPYRAEPRLVEKPAPELTKEQLAQALAQKEAKLQADLATGEAQPTDENLARVEGIPIKNALPNKIADANAIAAEQKATADKIEVEAAKQAKLASQVKSKEAADARLSDEYIRNEQLKREAAAEDLAAANAELEKQITLSTARKQAALAQRPVISGEGLPGVKTAGPKVVTEPLTVEAPITTKIAPLPKQTLTPEQKAQEILTGKKVTPEQPLTSNALRIVEPSLKEELTGGKALVNPVEERPAPLKLVEPPKLQSTPAINTVEPVVKKQRPSEAWFNFFKQLGITRGVDLQKDGILVDPKTGKSVSGLAYVREGTQQAVAKVNPNKQGFDTAGHEIFHVMVDDMLKGPSKVRSKLAQKAINRYAELEGVDAATAEEHLTSDVGADGVNRALGKDTGFANTVKDIVSNFKARFGPKGLATKEDWTRLMSNKLINDRAWTPADVSMQSKVGGASGVRPQDEPAVTSLPDYIPTTRNPAYTPDATPEQREVAIESQRRAPPARIIVPVDEAILRHPTLGKDPAATLVAEAFLRNTHLRNYNEGWLSTAPREAASHSPVEVRDSYLQKAIEADLSGTPATFTPEEQALEDIFRPLLLKVHEEMIRLGKKINGRDPISNPTYFMSKISPEAQEAITQHPGSAKAIQVEKDIIDHWTNAGIEDPQSKFNDYKTGLSGAIRKGVGEVDFTALNTAEGAGLPASVRDTDLLRTIESYGLRAAKTLAFHEAITSQPKVIKAMGLKDQHGQPAPDDLTFEDGTPIRNLGTTDQVINAIQHARGVVMSSPTQMAIARLASTLKMSIKTGVSNTLGVLPVTMGYTHIKDYPQIVRAAFKARSITKRALQLNAIKHNQQTLMFGSGPEGVNKWADRFNALSDKIWNIQQGPLERWGRKWSLALGDLLNPINIIHAQQGDKKAIRFVKIMGESLPPGRIQELISSKGEATQDDLDKMSAVFVRKVQQAYDASDQPAFTLEGPSAPFFALSRWSIGRANDVMKNVVDPLIKTGDPIPALMLMLGSAVVGLTKNELKKVWNGLKKDFSLTNQEIFKTTDARKSQIAAGIIDVMQLGDVAGVYGDVMKMVSDAALKGQLPRGYNIPVTDSIFTLGEDLANLAGAWHEGSDRGGVLIEFAKKVISDQMADLRIILNFAQPKKVARQNRFRDKAVFDKLTDTSPKADSSVIGHASNPFSRVDAKAFKHADNAGDAIKMLPGLRANAVRRAGGNPEKFEDELRSLKINSYQTMPNPNNDPEGWTKYYKFLVDTQGKEAADARVADYVRQNAVNKFKSSVVAK